MANKAKTCAIICAHNEQRTIADIASRTKAQPCIDSVIVIDDGSTDETYKEAMKSGAIVLQHDVNKGKGAALRTGFSYSLEKDYGRIATLDADGQHLPEDIQRFAEQLDQRFEIAVGHRNFTSSKYKIPFSRKLGNKIDAAMLSLILGTKVKDPQNGYRMFTHEPLEKVLCDNKNSGFTLEIEMLVKAIREGYNIGWVPIETIYKEEIKSHIRSVKHIKDSVRLYLSTVFGKI